MGATIDHGSISRPPFCETNFPVQNVRLKYVSYTKINICDFLTKESMSPIGNLPFKRKIVNLAI